MENKSIFFVMAPTDTRRITGPENSRDYRIYVSKEKSKTDLHKRPDSRANDDDHRTVCKQKIKDTKWKYHRLWNYAFNFFCLPDFAPKHQGPILYNNLSLRLV